VENSSVDRKGISKIFLHRRTDKFNFTPLLSLMSTPVFFLHMHAYLKMNFEMWVLSALDFYTFTFVLFKILHFYCLLTSFLNKIISSCNIYWLLGFC
jgi:hypothetical protein